MCTWESMYARPALPALTHYICYPRYGKHSSIAATVGTAKKIHVLNASTAVLMYWNSALHYNFYECESQVQPSWTFPNPGKPSAPPYYNYSVPAFRAWWVRCAVGAIANSSGELGGLFLDGNPKLEHAHAGLELWGKMVDELRAALPKVSSCWWWCCWWRCC